MSLYIRATAVTQPLNQGDNCFCFKQPRKMHLACADRTTAVFSFEKDINNMQIDNFCTAINICTRFKLHVYCCDSTFHSINLPFCQVGAVHLYGASILNE